MSPRGVGGGTGFRVEGAVWSERTRGREVLQQAGWGAMSGRALASHRGTPVIINAMNFGIRQIWVQILGRLCPLPYLVAFLGRLLVCKGVPWRGPRPGGRLLPVSASVTWARVPRKPGGDGLRPSVPEAKPGASVVVSGCLYTCCRSKIRGACPAVV